MKAKYKCLKCDHKFEGQPGPAQYPKHTRKKKSKKPIPTQCPKRKCHHQYVKWLNYEDFKVN